MTAPCFFAKGDQTPPTDGEPVQCECPTVTGKYQVGQPGQQCTIDGGTTYVWSAAYSVPADGGQ